MSTQIYEVNGDAAFADDDRGNTSSAECDEGDTVISGSYGLSSPALTADVADRANPDHTGWFVDAVAVDGATVIIQVVAQCFDNPPFHIP